MGAWHVRARETTREFVGIIVGHVKKMVLGVLVLNHWFERLLFPADVEPRTSTVGWETSEGLLLLVGFAKLLVEEVLAEPARGEPAGGGDVGSQAINRLVEADS